ncbi:MAG: CRISPR-associated protein Csb2 [Actinomycetota bacterium]|nr:CRISPR-associated protein Csb2 [Actinomycetota bacterium]
MTVTAAGPTTVGVTTAGGTESGDMTGTREWPPHPAEVFFHLARSAVDESDREALRWLERQLAPRVHLSSAHLPSGRLSPALLNRPRPADPPTSLTWESRPSSGVGQRLDTLVRRSRAGEQVKLRFGRHDPVGGSVTVHPCPLTDADLALGIPFPGFLDRLAGADVGEHLWQASRFTGYRFTRPRAQREPPGAPAVARREPRYTSRPPSAYTDIVVLTMDSPRGRRIPGRYAARLAEALRRAVLATAGDLAPEVLHGHRADGLPHVAFLALPDVGEPSSDGRILGLAVAVPSVCEAERLRIVRAVRDLRRRSGTDIVTLRGPGFGTADFRFDPGHVRPWTTSPERWRRGSRRWTTVTPLVLDHFPKRPAQIERRIRESVLRVGLPDPLTVRFDTGPLLPGGVTLRRHELPERTRRKLYFHVELTFQDLVAGPVLVGAGRHLGVGLFAPTDHPERSD